MKDYTAVEPEEAWRFGGEKKIQLRIEERGMGNMYGKTKFKSSGAKRIARAVMLCIL